MTWNTQYEVTIRKVTKRRAAIKVVELHPETDGTLPHRRGLVFTDTASTWFERNLRTAARKKALRRIAIHHQGPVPKEDIRYLYR